MKPRSTEHQQAMRALLLTRFSNIYDTARKYLGCILRAPIAEQEELFRMVIFLHDTLCSNAKCRPPLKWIAEEDFEEIFESIGSQVISWANAAVRANDSLDATASMLWEKLQGLEGNDQVVALGIILGHLMVPYVQIPSNLVSLIRTEEYVDLHNAIPYEIALMARCLHCGVMGSAELADAVTTIFERIENHDARTAAMHYLLHRISVIAAHRQVRITNDDDEDDDCDDE